MAKGGIVEGRLVHGSRLLASTHSDNTGQAEISCSNKVAPKSNRASSRNFVSTSLPLSPTTKHDTALSSARSGPKLSKALLNNTVSSGSRLLKALSPSPKPGKERGFGTGDRLNPSSSILSLFAKVTGSLNLLRRMNLHRSSLQVTRHESANSPNSKHPGSASKATPALHSTSVGCKGGASREAAASVKFTRVLKRTSASSNRPPSSESSAKISTFLNRSFKIFSVSLTSLLAAGWSS
mmetsp:Transcript_8052/g.9565  ORF Transcript_8052/g.9565 Transcript_8052/m.9565 type:complete len:238 (+) Transcript_8052:2569-3282(+)